MTISQLYLYPIKSLAGIPVAEAQVTDRGFRHDRRYMLVTPKDGQFITIRRFPKMTLFRPLLAGGGIQVRYADEPAGRGITLPLELSQGERLRVTVWEQQVEALAAGEVADRWFSERLGVPCRLVYMPDESHRPAKPKMGELTAGKITSFADAYPYLLLSEASLADLNDRYAGAGPLTMERFRPNLVVRDCPAYAEDELDYFSINGIRFRGVENCARCNVPNVDPATGEVSPLGEPLRTLAGYRRWAGKVWFGRNVVNAGADAGGVRVGDAVAEER